MRKQIKAIVTGLYSLMLFGLVVLTPPAVETLPTIPLETEEELPENGIQPNSDKDENDVKD